MSDRLRRERRKPPRPPGSPFSYGNAWARRQVGSWAGSISFDNSFRLALGMFLGAFFVGPKTAEGLGLRISSEHVGLFTTVMIGLVAVEFLLIKRGHGRRVLPLRVLLGIGVTAGNWLVLALAFALFG